MLENKNKVGGKDQRGKFSLAQWELGFYSNYDDKPEGWKYSNDILFSFKNYSFGCYEKNQL